MREDEMEALLALDGAGLRVMQVYAGFEAKVMLPANPTALSDVVSFTGFSPHRQDAIAQAWQKYQQFMSTEAGRTYINDGSGQLMFRI